MTTKIYLPQKEVERVSKMSEREVVSWMNENNLYFAGGFDHVQDFANGNMIIHDRGCNSREQNFHIIAK